MAADIFLVQHHRSDYVVGMSDSALPPQRCRLVLVLTEAHLTALSDTIATHVGTALSGGDVASILICQGGVTDIEFQGLLKKLIPVAHEHDVAVIVEGDSRAAARAGADGLQVPSNLTTARDAIEQYTPKMMIGIGNVKSRHSALEIGELEPDYLMFGKAGGDIRPEPHPKNVELGGWWSAMVEIPCIVMGGTDIDAIRSIADAGCEFAALSTAIIPPDPDAIAHSDPGEQVRLANEILDKYAPTFDDEDA